MFKTKPVIRFDHRSVTKPNHHWATSGQRVVPLLVLMLTGVGCTSILKIDNSAEALKNDEAEHALNIRDLPADSGPGLYVRLPGPPPQTRSANEPIATPAPAPGDVPAPEAGATAASNVATRNTNKPLVGKKARRKKNSTAEQAVTVVAPTVANKVRQPLIEDSEGFNGRRPKVDPFRVNERVTLEASFFAVTAGDITFETRPFVAVNGRKSYHFAGVARSTSVFAMFYAVDDWFETFVDYETLVPYSYALHVKESKQLRESRCIFNWQKMIATFWDKRVTKDRGVEDKKVDWPIPPYSQNIFTTIFYLRNFQMPVGKKISYRVAHEKENLVLTAEVIRKEHIDTPAGEFDTVVIKPRIELDGEFKPVGDIFVWLTDDDRKLVVRVESKLKIGKIVAVAKKVEYGDLPQ